MSDSESEVGRIMAERPPSSYGSMCSDDPQDHDNEKVVPPPFINVNLTTKIKLQRPVSPETAITSITQDQSSGVQNEGVYIIAHSKVQEPGNVIMEEEDEGDVRVNEPRDSPRTNNHVELGDPEHTLSHTPAQFSELDLPHVFTSMLRCLRDLNVMELQCFVRTLCSQSKGQLDFQQLEQEGDVLDFLSVVDRILEKLNKGEALNLTIRSLFLINKKNLATTLQHLCARALVQYELRASHKRRYYNLYEGTCRPGQQSYIRNVYVESPIVLESPTYDGRIVCTSDLFTSLEGEGRVRLVVTTGVPAIGLSVAVQMFLMDWTEELACQQFQFVFALPGRDLHLVRPSEQTFLEFLTSFYPDLKHAEFLACPDCTVLFAIDALELCRNPLDFQNKQSVTEITALAPVDTLLTSLIKGDLLPHASVWITAHRFTSGEIPASFISRFTELKGFGDLQKDEYFTKRTKDPTLGRRVLEQVKGYPDLYDACYLPLFCWIVSYVYERRLQNRGFAESVPTLTTFYTQYIIVMTNRKIERYVGTGLDASRWRDSDKDFLLKMGELALEMLLEERSVFYESDVSRLALNVHDVTHRGGISSATDKPLTSLKENGRSFRFVHHSVQKFIAAMYVYVTFRMTGKNVFSSHTKKTSTQRPVSELYKPVIDSVLIRRDGNLDLFLQFLLGMAARGTDMHLRGHLLPQYHPEPQGVEDVIRHAKKKIQENAVPERCRCLEMCISELNENRDVP